MGEPVEALAQDASDAILLDLTLPDAKIEPLIRTLASAPNTPVVVLGGQADEGLAVCALQSGVQDYLLKSNINRQWLTPSLRFAIEWKDREIGTPVERPSAGGNILLPAEPQASVRMVSPVR